MVVMTAVASDRLESAELSCYSVCEQFSKMCYFKRFAIGRFRRTFSPFII